MSRHSYHVRGDYPANPESIRAADEFGRRLGQGTRTKCAGSSLPMNRFLSGEWAVERTSAATRRKLHYWLTVLWVTVGTVAWIVAWIILRDAL